MRRTYTVALVLLGVIGLVLAGVPFIGSLSPTDNAKAEWASWNTPPEPNLERGHVLIRQISNSERRENADGSWSPLWGKRDLLIRDHDGKFYSFRLPTWNGKVVLPRLYWGQWDGECEELGPKTTNGALLSDTTIRCNDSAGSWWSGDTPEWSLAGESLVKPYPDLPKLRCKDEGRGELTCY